MTNQNIIDFLTVAVQYTETIENVSSLPAKDFLEKTQKILSLTYLKALLLRDVTEEEPDEIFSEQFVTEVHWQNVQNNILTLLGENNDYLEVFVAGMEYTEEPITQSIAENLADIYQDLKNFAMLCEKGGTSILRQASNECMSYFDEEWGQKLVNVQRAIHALLVNRDIDWNAVS